MIFGFIELYQSVSVFDDVKRLPAATTRKTITNKMIRIFHLIFFIDYLRKEISGSEMLFFKGSRFLEGVIEHLLADKNDINKLCRREKIWKIRRKKWDL